MSMSSATRSYLALQVSGKHSYRKKYTYKCKKTTQIGCDIFDTILVPTIELTTDCIWQLLITW